GTRPTARGLDGEDDVLSHAEVADNALVTPVLTREGDAVRQRGGGLGDVGRATAQPHGAGVGLVCPVDETGEFGAAGSEQARETDNLSAVQVEVDLLEHAPLPDADGRVERIAFGGIAAGATRLDRGERGGVLADHLRDELGP